MASPPSFRWRCLIVCFMGPVAAGVGQTSPLLSLSVWYVAASPLLVWWPINVTTGHGRVLSKVSVAVASFLIPQESHPQLESIIFMSFSGLPHCLAEKADKRRYVATVYESVVNRLLNVLLTLKITMGKCQQFTVLLLHFDCRCPRLYKLRTGSVFKLLNIITNDNTKVWKLEFYEWRNEVAARWV